jgi:hypothetical protein
MFLLLLSILILFIPSVFQIIIGNKSLGKSIPINYFIVCVISLIMQLIITVLSFCLAIKSIIGSGNKCATGAVSIFLFSFLITLLMLFIMVVQFVKSKLREKKEQYEENEMAMIDEFKESSNSYDKEDFEFDH